MWQQFGRNRLAGLSRSGLQLADSLGDPIVGSVEQNGDGPPFWINRKIITMPNQVVELFGRFFSG